MPSKVEVVIDFETRSRLELKYTNAYKYARHPSTEAICLGWGEDATDENIWRPADGGFPLEYYFSPCGVFEWGDITLAAFNAEFELEIWNNVCVPRFGWPELNPLHVRCLQARASYGGLPRKLERIGPALGLGVNCKDSNGHTNMLWLRKPVRAKRVGCEYFGGEFDDDRVRHEKNERYCIQDIKTESLVGRLSPDLPPAELRLWQAHRSINRRGVPVDLALCRNAAQLVGWEMKQLREELTVLTGGVVESPNQLLKLKAWIEERGFKLTNMRSETLDWAIQGGNGEVPPDVLRALKIRKLCRDAAVSKYQSVLNHADEDGYCRGAHVFYKAGPGRFAGCVPGDTSVLTPEGWERLDKWRGGPIAQFDPITGEIKFFRALLHKEEPTNNWLDLGVPRLRCMFTPDHTMPYLYHPKLLKWTVKTAAEVSRQQAVRLPAAGNYSGSGSLDAAAARVVAAVQADAHFELPGYRKCARCTISLKKSRKITRLRELLGAAGIRFSERRAKSKPGYVIFYIAGRDYPIWFGPKLKQFGAWLLDLDSVSITALLDEVWRWDGHETVKAKSRAYFTTNRENAEWVQTLSHLAGRIGTISVRPARGNRKEYYRVGFRDKHFVMAGRKNWLGNTGLRTPYCPRTQTGFWLAKSAAGTIFITGNSGVNFHNLRRLNKGESGSNAALADRVSAADPTELRTIYEDLQPWRTSKGVIPTLAAIVRLAVCAHPGNKLVVCDYSSIEMRVLHWLANDVQTLKQIRAFDNGCGEEPYKLAAASVYNKSVSQVTEADRQTGKVMILGCGYMSGAEKFAGFCANYGIDMPLDKSQELVQFYRRSYPLVKKLWYALGKSAVRAIRTGETVDCGKVSFYMTGHALNCRLPSGRELKYYDAQIINGVYGDELEALDQRGGLRKVVGLPVLIENIDQAVSRDLLADALIKCQNAHLPVVLHVYDEIVIEVPEADTESAITLRKIMRSVPAWAEGLPIDAKLGEGKRYIK